jgi:membrane peptidoglycan carboxypeptidase
MAVLGLKRRRSDGGEIPPPPPVSATAPGPPPSPKKTKPRLKKLRVLFVLLGLGVLAVVSMIFGMMAAISQDLPAIYDFAEYKASKNSEVYDANGEPLGTLTRARSPPTSRMRWSRSRTPASMNTKASTSAASPAP